MIEREGGGVCDEGHDRANGRGAREIGRWHGHARQCSVWHARPLTNRVPSVKPPSPGCCIPTGTRLTPVRLPEAAPVAPVTPVTSIASTPAATTAIAPKATLVTPISTSVPSVATVATVTTVATSTSVATAITPETPRGVATATARPGATKAVAAKPGEEKNGAAHRQ